MGSWQCAVQTQQQQQTATTTEKKNFLLSFVEIERLARWHSAQTRLMWLGFLDTAQRHFVEAQATSGKAPPPVCAFSGRDEPACNRNK